MTLIRALLLFNALWLSLPALALPNIFPDTLSFDIATNRTFVELDQRETLVGRKQISGNFLGDAGQLVDSLTLTTLPRHTGENYKFIFRWVPTFSFAFNNIVFDTPSVFLSETDFQIFRVSLGIGPEFSLDTFLGTIYVSVAPGGAYSWVSWSSPVGGGSMARSNINWSTSFGYYKFITQNFALRVFIRQVVEDKGVWDEALDSSQGFNIPVKSVYNSIAGVSISYTF